MKLKKGEVAFEQIIILILVLLVVASVIMFIYRNDILNYIRILPGYTLPEEDIIVTDIPEDIKTQAQQLCPGGGIVGYVGGLEGIPGFKEQYIYINGIGKTDLYWEGDELNAEIRWAKNLGNPKVASVKNGVIDILPIDLDIDYTEEILAYLKLIHNSKLLNVNKLLCKNEI